MVTDRLRKNLDVPMLFLTALLCILGTIILFSTTHLDPSPAWKKQLILTILGAGLLAGAAYIDYHVYARFAKHVYLFNLLMLLAVLKIHHSINGAARWINLGGFMFQPSEFAKLFVILTLAVFLTKRQERIHEFGVFLQSLGYVLVPMVLIFKQPDLGTALVILSIWAGMVFIAGAKLQHIAALVIVSSVLFVGLWSTNLVIKPYQKQRLIIFFNPGLDKNGAGYHVTQAKTAIGSGQFLGKGWLQGSMVHGGYIPERQTDFIYTTVGEELGFLGCVALVVLYSALLFRGAQVIASSNEDLLGKLVATGIVAMFAFHVILNIGMNIGILPVAGVPLPLISAGGTNVLTTLICIGLLESVAIHRHQLMF